MRCILGGAASGWQVALEHERRQQRSRKRPIKIYSFDIRSRDPNTAEIRYIEVKARSTTAAVALTCSSNGSRPNSFNTYKAYYLYVVMLTAKNPNLHIIQNWPKR